MKMNEKANVKLSTRSWHYKLIKFILGSAAPTPWNMHNLCPYFWLMIFSMLVFPVVAPIKVLFRLAVYVLDAMDRMLYDGYIRPAAEKWEDALSDLDVFLIWNWELPISKSYIKTRYSGVKPDLRSFAMDWWRSRYDPENTLTNEEVRAEFKKWDENMHTEYHNYRNNARALRDQQDEANARRLESVSKIQTSIGNFLGKIGDAFRSWKSLIVWTKRFVGLCITAVGLVISYFAVNYAGRGVLWLVDNWDWRVVIGVGICLATVFLIIGLIKGLAIIVDTLQERGRTDRFVNLLYNVSLIFYLPMKWVFYNFVWRILLVGGFKLLKNCSIFLWRGIMGFLGIFGEYFGASYTDYCPGIEWEEDED
jgi:hypothetical protein